MEKKQESYIKFLIELADQTMDEQNKEQILEKIKEVEEGKDEEYLDIDKKDEGIFLSDG